MFAENKKLLMIIAVAGVLLVFSVVAMLMLAINPRNTDYEIVPLGAFDHIEYVGGRRFLVQQGEERTVRDELGNIVIANFGQFVEHFDEYILTLSGETFTVFNPRGREIAVFDGYDSVRFAAPDRFIVGASGEYAVVSRRGREIISPGEFSNIIPTEDDLFVVQYGRNFGIANRRGRVIVPLEHDLIVPAGNNRFIMTQGPDKWVMSSGGSDIIPPGRFDRIYNAGHGYFEVWTMYETDIRTGIADRHGVEVVPVGRYDFVAVAGNDRFIVRSGEVWDLHLAVLDSSGNEIISGNHFDEIGPLGEGVFVRTDDREGFLSLDGNVIIPIGRYDQIHTTVDNFAIVTNRGQLGVVNINRIP